MGVSVEKEKPNTEMDVRDSDRAQKMGSMHAINNITIMQMRG